MTESTQDAPDADRRGQRTVEAPTRDTPDVARSAGRGALWQVLGGCWQSVVRLGASTVLARLLMPEEFGIMGMAILTRGLVRRIGAFAMKTGVIAKGDLTEDDLCTAFWLSAVTRVFLFVVAFVASPLAAAFFHIPALTWVVRAVSLTFIFSAVSFVPQALLHKQLRFGAAAVIQGAAIAVEAAAAILLALTTELKYWALVAAMLIGSFFLNAATVAYLRWRPRFRFSKASFRYLFRYGVNDLGSSVANYFHNNIDYLVVGRLLGAHLLGLYEFAYRIPHLVRDRVAKPVATVVFPALSTVQSRNDRLLAGYTKATKYIGLLVFPILGSLAVLGRQTVLLLWGERWLPIVLPLQILCLSAAARCLLTPVNSVFLCKNRPDIPCKFAFATLAVTLLAVGGLGYAFGLVGAAAGMVLSLVPNVFAVWLAFRLMGCGLGPLLRSLRPPILSSCVSSVCALGAATYADSLGWPLWAVWGLGVATSVSVYLVSLRSLFPRTASDIRSTLASILGAGAKKAVPAS